MGAISNLIQSYNANNYIGELFSLSPSDCPLVTMLGGLGNFQPSLSKQITWQSVDNAAASQPAIVEGADATFGGRSRSEIINVCQIFQEGYEVSYTKQAAIGNLGGQAILGNQPVDDEMAFQRMLKLEKIKRDAEYAFLLGSYVADTDINTARKTQGVFNAVSTNLVDVRDGAPAGTTLTGCTATASTDVITKTAHGLVDGDEFEFTLITSGAAGLATGTAYWVVSSTSTTFKVAASRGGAAIDITTDGTTITVKKRVALTKARFDKLLRTMAASDAPFRNPVIFASAFQKQKLSAIFGFAPMDRNIGGVNLSVIETDFAKLGVVWDRFLPADYLGVADMSVLKMHALVVPASADCVGGVLFDEPLGKSGSVNKRQIYGELGLEYGPEKWHGLLRGLTTDEALS